MARPRIADELRHVKKLVSLSPSDFERLKAIGGGSLSAGIRSLLRPNSAHKDMRQLEAAPRPERKARRAPTPAPEQAEQIGASPCPSVAEATPPPASAGTRILPDLCPRCARLGTPACDRCRDATEK